MLKKIMFYKATNAAALAMACGFEETSKAFQEMALVIYCQMTSAERQSLICGDEGGSTIEETILRSDNFLAQYNN